MSRNEWENGELTLSVAEFSKFRKALVESVGKTQADLLAKAKALYDDLIRTASAEQGQSIESRVARRLDTLGRASRVGYGGMARQDARYDEAAMDALRQALMTQQTWPKEHDLKRPTSSHSAFQAEPLPPAGDARRPLVRANNQIRAILLDQAKQIHAKVIADATPGPIQDKVQRHLRAHPLPQGLPPTATQTLFSALVVPRPAHLKRPLAKDFAAPKASTLVFRNSEVTLTLDPEQRKVYWNVPENNHAVEAAWQSSLGQTFNRLLKTVNWTPRTGGRFWGGDEYHDDAIQDSGEGEGSYTTQRFGPLGEDKSFAATTRPRLRR